jgi:hypothetical protein
VVISGVSIAVVSLLGAELVGLSALHALHAINALENATITMLAIIFITAFFIHQPGKYHAFGSSTRQADELRFS